jgi:hypothetical protein
MIPRMILPLLALALSVGCASKTLREEEAKLYFAHAGDPVEEIRAFRLNNWRPLDRDHLVIWRSVNEAYLLKVSGPCTNLEFAQEITVDYRAPVLRSRFDAIRVEGYRCPIDSIRPVDYPRVRQELRNRRG